MLSPCSKTSPDVIRKFACLPKVSDPNSAYAPIISAGTCVNDLSACFFESPIFTALRRFFKKSDFFFNPSVVKAKTIWFSSKNFGFDGANSQCFISSKDTCLAS